MVTPHVRCIVNQPYRKFAVLSERGFRDMTAVADNGVNAQALLDAREVLKTAPEAAQFTWRASSKRHRG
jgi:hypothetical protein